MEFPANNVSALRRVVCGLANGRQSLGRRGRAGPAPCPQCRPMATDRCDADRSAAAFVVQRGMLLWRVVRHGMLLWRVVRRGVAESSASLFCF